MPISNTTVQTSVIAFPAPNRHVLPTSQAVEAKPRLPLLLPSVTQLVTVPYTEPDESSPHPDALFLYDQFF